MDTVFTDAPAWPDSPQQRDSRFDNEPPLEERIMLEFEEALERDGITARVAELLESASRCPPVIADEAVAGKAGDLCKLARDVEKRINDAREKHNRPLLNAQRALKGKADGVFAPLATAVANIRSALNHYMAEQSRQRAEEQRRVDEAARLAREAAAKAAPDAPPPVIEAPKIEVPVARGDLGARVGARTVWRHEIEVPIAKLPKALLESAPVREAIDKVIAAQVRAGTREIKGVRIWSEQEAAVR